MTVLKLERINLPEAHVFRGEEFPAAYDVKNDDGRHSSAEVIAYLNELGSTGFFREELKKHGAIVLRNTGTTDPEILSEYVRAIGESSGEEQFVQTGVTAKRTIITDVLSTANEGPSENTIHQHNEFSRFNKYPTTLFFVCTRYDAEGGTTPIVHGGEFFEKIDQKYPKFLTELADRGLYMRQTWANVSPNHTAWHDFFCFGRDLRPEEDLKTRQEKAAKLVREFVSEDFEWDDNNNLIVGQHSRPIRKYKVSDSESYPAFFNSIATYYADVKYSPPDSKKTSALSYDDLQPIPTEYLDEVLQQSIDLAYHHQWKEGDIAIVDNYQVSHGRDPWKGDRKLLVSMWDQKNKPEYEPWVR
ncbi:hypothetical protein OGAPHI_001357 [Ogataea philodendri]|uniref:TauD/TfdA-like domain-containing protein n=1 Tax=Ogataea philodendri TaxID=1378263 RepID=A0A9P8PCF2_9ASCO|nr:uncharacterized protein OGAPHI_001357 [Ogataea philodendri]KAH3669236.1 hypothetical protein OGAPHI_001357 [Ogataea philodendri]